MKKFLALGFWIGTAALPLAAATLPIRVLAWDQDIAERPLALSSGDRMEEIPMMHPFKRSHAVRITIGESPPRLLALDMRDQEGNPVSAPLRIPQGIKSPLLVLLPDEKSPTGLRTFFIEDSTDDFQWGTTRFINSTGRELVFVWEKRIIRIPASWKPTDVKPGGPNRSVGVQLFVPENASRPVYSAVWEHTDVLRKLVFLMPNANPRLGPIAFKTITEDRRVTLAEEQHRRSRAGSSP